MAHENWTLWRRWAGAALVLLMLLNSISAALAAPGTVPAPDRPAQQVAYPGLDSSDPTVRADAVQAIRAAKDKRAVRALLAHLEDPDQRVGLYIAQALVELASDAELALLRSALWLVNPDGRWRAAFVLGERRDVRAIPVLERTLRDEEVLVGRTAAEALARIGGTAAARALVRGLYSDRPAEVMAAKNGLLRLGDAAIPELRRALESGIITAELNATLVLETIGTPAARAALQ